MKNSFREELLFNDIKWMMVEFDLIEFCHRMNWKIQETETHIVTFCPDHHLRRDAPQSDPKCYIDKKTGQTHCKTCDYGSNLVWILKRLLNCSAQKAYEFIVGKENLDGFSGLNWKILKKRVEEGAKIDDNGCEAITYDNFAELKREIFEGQILQSGYDYFKKPPSKKETNIDGDTLKYFRVIQRDYGYFKDRVIVPVYLKKVLTGFVAIDILGEKKRLELCPNVEYKKLLYPKGFKSGSNLFNYDNVQEGAEYLIIVEGVRDVMKLWQMGYRNVVSIFGTSLSQNQYKLISEKYPEFIYILLDGDNAGISAAKKISLKLYPMDSKIALLPLGEDPKTISKEILDKCLQKAKLTVHSAKTFKKY